MKKILVMAGSSHKKSINLALAKHAAKLQSAEPVVLDLNDFEMPIYSEDREKTDGIPPQSIAFLEKIREVDGVIISLAEHNGSYSVAFKNLLDWTSRHELKFWSDKPMLLMATSPGGRGGAGVLEAAQALFPRLGARVIATFSLPGYFENFSESEGITNPELASKLSDTVNLFVES